MPSDPSIYSMIRPTQVEGPLDQYAKMMSVKSLMDQSQLSGLQRQQLEGDLGEQQSIKDLYARAAAEKRQPTQQEVMAAAPGRGPGIVKSMLDQEKTRGEIDKGRIERIEKSLSLYKGLLADVNTPQDAAKWLTAQFNDPNLSPLLQQRGSPQEQIARLPQDPEGFQQWKIRNGLGMEKELEDAARRRTATETGRHNAATESQAAAALAQTAAHQAKVEEQGKIPSGYRATADGRLEAIPGGPADLGKALPHAATKDIGEAGAAVENTRRLRSTFKDEYGGKTVMGDLSNTTKRIVGDDTGQAQWWQDMDAQQNVTRHALFGSALTSQELAQWNKTSITPRMDPQQIRDNLTRRAEIEARAASKLARSYEAAGYNKAQIKELLGTAAEYIEKPAPPVSGAAPRADTKGGDKPKAGGIKFIGFEQ